MNQNEPNKPVQNTVSASKLPQMACLHVIYPPPFTNSVQLSINIVRRTLADEERKLHFMLHNTVKAQKNQFEPSRCR